MVRSPQTYLSLFNNMSNFMRKPNIIVYLDVTPEESYQRIAARSRECESGLPLEYLKKLSAAYEDFLEDVRAARRLMLRRPFHHPLPHPAALVCRDA